MVPLHMNNLIDESKTINRIGRKDRVKKKLGFDLCLSFLTSVDMEMSIAM